MRARRYASLPVLLWAVVALAPALLARQAPAASGASVKIWLGHHREFEDFLKRANTIGKMEKLPVGITNPKKVALERGGPVDYIVWKPLAPGYHGQDWENYKAEIAAYEIDKLIGLDMVPPTVEKRIDNQLGAAVMWVSGTTSFGEIGKAPQAPKEHEERWNLQIIRAFMFDNLIGNEDPNLGNWLMDTNWNLVLIDHSRSLRNRHDLYHAMNRIDRKLWERMKLLDVPQLTSVLQSWLTKPEINAILERRDRMQKEIDKLVKKKGEAQTFIDAPKGGAAVPLAPAAHP
jgi:hypothetical protein